MKAFTLLICVLLFVLNAAEDDNLETAEEKAITKAKHLIKQLKLSTEKHQLVCGNYMEYCDNNPDVPEDLEDVCPVIFDAYLCNDITTPEGIVKVLQQYEMETSAEA